MKSEHGMVRVFARIAAFALLAGLSLSAFAAGTSVSTQDVIEDAAKAWDRFLATANYEEAYKAYDSLADVGYALLEVDAAGCAEHATTLATAVEAAPVSLALHRARMMCAEATGDDAAAEESMQAIAALSALALADGREPFWPRPIRVLGPTDIYALLASSGLAFRYEYYVYLRARRHFTLTVAAWDDVLGVERHLAFDFVDAVNAITRNDEFSGYPFQRQLLAESFVEGQAAAGESQAIDWKATRDASLVDAAEEKVAALRAGVEVGGVQSLSTWLVVCNRNALPGCADGLVDALLPHAEQQHAIYTVLLSIAYATGAGVDRDDDAAATLLDAARRRWHGEGALVAFAQLWGLLQRDTPAFLQDRLTEVGRSGNISVSAVSAWLALSRTGVPELDERQVAALSHPTINGVGMGYALLTTYHRERKEPFVTNAWLKHAADAGDPDAQAAVGVELFKHAESQDARDQALRLTALGAQGGNAYAMRFMAYQARLRSKWAEAEGWLLAAAGAGNVEALFDLGDLYEWERPGVRGPRQRAIDLYRALAEDPAHAEARRRLAMMALTGRGIEKDKAQAERWLLQDADAGDGESAAALASMYLMDEDSRDEAKGIEWMERAIELGFEDAYVDYGSWWFHEKGQSLDARKRGLDLWDRGAEAGARWALNNAAWARCTAPEPEIFDPAQGTEQAKRIISGDDVPPGMLDTVAACHAAAGEFAQAIEVQQRVISMLDPDQVREDQERQPNFHSRLEEYRAGKRHVEPRRETSVNQD